MEHPCPPSTTNAHHAPCPSHSPAHQILKCGNVLLQKVGPNLVILHHTADLESVDTISQRDQFCCEWVGSIERTFAEQPLILVECV